jgi:putative (di)nucleoside polyphosphate hydrolase
MAGQPDDRTELTISELIADPMVRAIMEADGIDERELSQLLIRAGERQVARDSGQYIPDGVELDPTRPLRRGVGIMLVNRDGWVFVGQRCDISGEAWQMPQGGIDPGETPQAAALRELQEEVGTANADVVAVTQDWLGYELPSGLLAKIVYPHFYGQAQQWFLMRFRGADDEINVTTAHPEFSDWKWIPPERLLDLIVPFKRDVYRRVLNEFAPLLQVAGSNGGAP